MKPFKKYIPIALLVAGLGLGFSATVNSQEQKTQEIKQKQLEEYIIGEKEYQINTINYEEYSNKSFSVKAKIKTKDTDFLSSVLLNVNFYCGTNKEGKFDIEILSIHNENSNARIRIRTEDLEPSFLRVDKKRYELWDMEDSKEKQQLVNFAKEKLETYRKIFKIEEKKANSKGKNLCHLLKDLDITWLKKENLETEDNITFYATKDRATIVLHAPPERNIRVLGINGEDILFFIFDHGEDEDADSIHLKTTIFEKNENGSYKYIKELYTEEQVKEIFRQANEKLKFANEVITK